MDLRALGVVVPFFKNPTAWARARCALEAEGVDPARIFVRDNSVDNVFYTATINEGLVRFADDPSSEFVLALTQDAVIQPGATRAMLSDMRDNPTVGLVAPVSLDSAGGVKWCGGSDSLPWGRHFTAPLDQLPKAPYPTLWVNGACVLIRTAMVRDIGPLDDSMRFIFSDVDYSFRARERGWGVVVCPFAFIEHELAGSSAAAPAWLQIVKLEDQIRFAEKWALGSARESYIRLSREARRMPPDRIRALCEESRAQIARLRLVVTV